MLAQGVGSFVVWILYGVTQARRSAAIRRSVERIPRGRRGLIGAASMLGGIAILFAGFLGIQAIGGLGRNAMTPLGWFLTTAVGLAFIHLQVLGMAMLVSIALEGVTNPHPAASTSADPAQET